MTEDSRQVRRAAARERGKRLRALRLRAGLLAREVAERVVARGLASSEQQITSYERGRTPLADKAEAIQAVLAEALGAREVAARLRPRKRRATA